MNLNRLHRLFGRNRTLSRQDIETYGKTEDPISKNTIERLSMESSFEKDAIEGWEEVGYNTNIMANLDQKFVKTPTTWIWYSVGIVSIIVVTVLITNQFSKRQTHEQFSANSIDQVSEREQEIVLEESDVLIPDEIQLFVEAPGIEQIKPAKIKNDFVQINETHELNLVLDTLPIKYIDVQPEKGLDLNRINGKEIYLHDLKLLDYSKYRTAPSIKTKQIILTGTPANMENDHSESYEGSWKEVRVPYMDYINKSIAIFNRGNYKKALTRFETILETYPDDLNANFYSGLCFYNFGEYSLAIERFNKCINGKYKNFDEESSWMMAQAYDHIGEIDRARTIYKQIIVAGGFYKDQARRKLNR